MAGDREGLPWPEGEPGGIRSAGSSLRALASGVSVQAGRLSGIAGSSPGTGAGVTAFAAMAGSQQEAIAAGAGALTDAAAALMDLADAVEEAQDTVEQQAELVKEAREAAEDARSAMATAGLALAGARNAHAAASPLLGSPLGSMSQEAAALGAAQGAYHRAAAAFDAAEARYQRVRAIAENKAARAVEDVEAADGAAAGVLGGVGEVTIDGPGGMPNPLGRLLALGEGFECPGPEATAFHNGVAFAMGRGFVALQAFRGAPLGRLLADDLDGQVEGRATAQLRNEVNGALDTCIPADFPLPPPPPPPPPFPAPLPAPPPAPAPAPAPVDKPFWPDWAPTPADAGRGIADGARGVWDGIGAGNEWIDGAIEDTGDWLEQNLPRPGEGPPPLPLPGRRGLPG